MPGLLRLFRSPVFTGFLIGVTVAAVIIVVRGTGHLQPLELGTYDSYLKQRVKSSAAESPVTLVTITESDIRALGQWPMSDATLTRVLRSVLEKKPRVIGLDLYRDMPVPPGKEQLTALFREGHDIITVRKIGDQANNSVAAPYMSKDPDRIGFNDIPVDADGVIRRSLIFMEDSGELLSSFSLLLALSYLRHDSISAGPAPDNPDLVKIGLVPFVPVRPDDGGYIKADAGGYQIMLDFGSRPFQAVPVGDLLAGTAGPELFHNRIVIIGSVAESMKDVFVTPVGGAFSGARMMQGLEIHAQFAGQIVRAALTGKGLMQPVPEWSEWLLVLLAGLAGGMVGSLGRSFPMLLAILVTGVITMVLATYLAFVADYWIPAVPPLLSWGISLGTMTAILSYREKTDRRLLMKIFSSHVSKDVAEAIWRERDRFIIDGRLIPRKMTATVLFTDLQDFTATAEKQGPDELMEWLNTYMNAMADAVMRHNGIVNKFIGDAVMAVFGAPVGDEDPASVSSNAMNAVRAALAMRDELESLNRKWENIGKAAVSMRVGIHTGPLVAGNIGSAERMEYTVLGDTVNTASRLESYLKEIKEPEGSTEHCRILISEATFGLVGNGFISEHVGEIRVKGKDKGLTVYRLTGSRK